VRFAGQPILISGAGRGLGEGIARHLASEGAIVGVADINGQTAHDVAAAIADDGGKTFAYQADLGKRQAFFDVAEAFKRDAGPLRTVINNASVLVYEPIEQVTEETLDRMLSAGLKSVFWGVQAFLAHRDETVTGNILNYSSPVAYRGRPNTGAYTTIKAGVAGLTKVLAGELGPRGIRVNAIAPGPVWTPLNVTDKDAKDVVHFGERVPMKRPAQPEEIAPAIVFFASPIHSSYITGEVLALLGGETTAA
jgi:meso-butanediol dehydrogenase/(S,S)-butanediol dehydrogenase/diacetyl reductase